MAQRSLHAGIAQLGQRRCVQVAVLNGSQVRILLPALLVLHPSGRRLSNVQPVKWPSAFVLNLALHGVGEGGDGGRIRTCEALAEDLESTPFDRSGTPSYG